MPPRSWEASEDKARKAAETMTENDDLFARIDDHFATIHRQLRQIKWMMGFALAFQIAIFIKLFMH